MAHGLRNFEFGFETVPTVFFTAQGCSKRAKMVGGRVKGDPLLDAWDVPLVCLLTDLLCCGVNNGVGFGPVTDSSTCGVCTLLVHCLQYCTSQSGVAGNGLIIHEPDVNKPTAMLDLVEGVNCVLLET